MILNVFFLSVSLSIDALFVGFAFGLDNTRIPLKSKLIICVFSILYSGLAIFAGTLISGLLPPDASRYIGAGILALIGISMIAKAIVKTRIKNAEKEQDESHVLFRFLIKPLHLTIQILKDPDTGDIDRSGVIDAREAILVGSALSFDALGAGFGSALSGINGIYIPFAIGLSQLLFLSLGLHSGRHFGLIKKIDEKYSSLIPGTFLLTLSLFRLL